MVSTVTKVHQEACHCCADERDGQCLCGCGSGANICCRRRVKSLSTRFRRASLDSLSRFDSVEEKKVTWFQFEKKITFTLCVLFPQKLLTNGDSSSREFVDPPGDFEQFLKIVLICC